MNNVRTILTVLILLAFVTLIIWNLHYLLLIVLSLTVNLSVFLLPEKQEGEGKWETLYNKLFDNETYKEK